MERTDLREYLTDAIRFWEPWRILYNLTLAAVVIIYFAIGYPRPKSTLTVDFCLGLFMLAVIATSPTAPRMSSTSSRKHQAFVNSGSAAASCCS